MNLPRPPVSVRSTVGGVFGTLQVRSDFTQRESRRKVFIVGWALISAFYFTVTIQLHQHSAQQSGDCLLPGKVRHLLACLSRLHPA